jgi:hypothetical protein
VQLSYVYNQIISVLTRSQLDRIFQQRSNFDLRRLLVGTDKFTDQLVDAMGVDASYFLSAVRCVRMPQPQRDKIGQIINQSKHSVSVRMELSGSLGLAVVLLTTLTLLTSIYRIFCLECW